MYKEALGFCPGPRDVASNVCQAPPDEVGKDELKAAALELGHDVGAHVEGESRNVKRSVKT